jgi:PAS domain S-box-containing protein
MVQKKGDTLPIDHPVAEHESAYLLDAQEQARRYAEKITEQVAGLQVFTAALSEALTPEAVAAIAIEQAVAITDAAAGSVLFLLEETSTLEVVASTNYSDVDLNVWQRTSLDTAAPLAEAVRTGQIIAVESVEALGVYYPDSSEKQQPTYEAAIFVPLIVEAATIGGMSLAFAEPRSFSEEDRLFVFTMARQLAQALKRARLYLEANRLNELLEQRVADRTRELHIINWTLQQEVEERLRVEEVLRQSESRLAETQRSARLGGWQWDKESNQLTWSAELYRIHGVESPSGPIPVDEAMGWIHPEDREEVLRLVQAAIEKRQSFALYHRIMSQDHQERIVHVRGQMLLDPFGEVVGMIGTGQDVTELKQTEAQLARHVTQVGVLQQIGQAVVASLDVREVLQRVCEQVAPLLGADGVAILLKEEDELICQAATGTGAATLERRRVSLTADYVEQVMHGGPPLLLEDLAAQSQDGEGQALCHGPGGNGAVQTGSLLLASLQLHGTILGLIEAVHGTAGAFDDEDAQLLAAAANWTAIAIDNARQHERLQRRLRESEALAAISRELSQTLDLGRTLRRIARAARRISAKIDGVVVYLAEPGSRYLRPVMVTGIKQDELDATILAPPAGVIGRAFYEGDVIHVADLQVGDWQVSLDSQPVSAMLAVPIRADAVEVVGVLGALSAVRGAFSPDDERLLVTLALQAGVAIQNTRLFEALDREKKRLELLYDLSQNLSSTLDPAEVAGRALQLMLPALGGHRGEILLFQPDSSELHSLTTFGNDGAETTHPSDRQPGPAHGLIDHVVRTRTAAAVSDVRHSEVWQTWPGLGDEIRSLVVMPLLANDELIGVLCLMSEQPSFYRYEQLPLLQAATIPVALAVSNARLYRAEQQARQTAEQLFEEVRTSQEQLLKMAEEVVSAQEDERRRISRELHDEAGQALTGIKISLSLLRDELPPDRVALHTIVDEAIQVTSQTMEQIRSLAHALHPPALTYLGLGPALEGFCIDFSRRTRLPVHFSCSDLPDLPGGVSVCFYRFLQEALTNSAKHAAATSVTVALTFQDDEICCQVIDDGRGFKPELLGSSSRRKMGLGIVGMQERFALLGGTLKIESREGEGACLTARLPWYMATDNVG